MQSTIHLEKTLFNTHPVTLLESGEFSVTTSRFNSGIEALTLANGRGRLVVLPFMGQMVWDAVFDGVDLTMTNIFKEPKPATTIVETYGCFLYHSGLLRNGCPGPEDDHPLHGEFPCAAMDRASLVVGEDEVGPFLRLVSEYEYAMGFGSHYLARPSLTLREKSGMFEVQMEVTNLSAAPMELMYMCHLNPLFVKGAELIQPVSWSPETTVTRTSIPEHVQPTQQWRQFLDEVAATPERMAVLNEPEKYNPEFVFFLRNLKGDAHGNARFLLKLPETGGPGCGGGCACSFRPEELPCTTRWILTDGDQQVAAFALPGTCEPEGYSREKEKGNVISLAGGERRCFTVRTGWLNREECAEMEAGIPR